jgi:hypothetical protein
MKTVHRLVGFAGDTEQMVFSQVVPDRLIDYARKIAHFTNDPQDVGNAPLTPAEARNIAGAMDVPIAAGMPQWFLCRPSRNCGQEARARMKKPGAMPGHCRGDRIYLSATATAKG